MSCEICEVVSGSLNLTRSTHDCGQDVKELINGLHVTKDRDDFVDGRLMHFFKLDNPVTCPGCGTVLETVRFSCDNVLTVGYVIDMPVEVSNDGEY